MSLSRLERADLALDRPVLVMAMEGWVDAGLAGANALAALLGSMSTDVVASFDADVLVDHRSRRPLQRIVNGLLESITFPEIQLRHGVDSRGLDVLILAGPEPDYRWRAFTEEVVELAVGLGTRMAVGLGGFPAPVPHTRPVRVVGTAVDAALATEVGFIPGMRDVPSGISASLVKSFERAGVVALTLWAMVPHYVAGMPYPDASAELLERLGQLSGIAVDTAELRAAAGVTRQRIDTLIGQSEQHQAMVEGLERQAEQQAANPAEAAFDAPLFDGDDLPSGDEIAAELQRFLRDQGQGQGHDGP